MTNFLLRRRKQGNTSCREIKNLSKEGIEVYRNDNPRIPDGDIVFRWGCTSNVEAKTIVNSAKAIHTVSDKLGFRRILQEKGLCPKTWFSLEEWLKVGHLPVVIRPSVHHQGRHTYLCKTDWDVTEALHKCKAVSGDFYISEFIPKVKEYRVFIVQGRTVCVANKTPGNPQDVAWNVARGGRFDNVNWDNWPLRAVRAATEAFALSGLDFGGVDVMEAADGSCTVLEINAAPSLTSPYRQECFAKAFDWIIKNGKEKIPLVQERDGYLKFIHPAINNNARIG